MSLKTLDNSLELLQYFTRENPSWGVRELAKEIGISHSIVYRILSSFEKYGFLVQDHITKKYELGFRFLEFGQIVKENMYLSDFVYPIMKNLAEKVEESVFLTWLDKVDGVTVEIAESSHKIKYEVSLGTRTPLYVGASCKVIMAYLPRDKQKEIISNGLRPFTENTILDEEKLLKDLDEIKNQGWGYSAGEFSESVFGLGVPLFNSENKIIASLTISGPEYRLPEKNLETVLGILQEEAKKIQRYFKQYNNHYR
ncbi:IclR family transcriptional regulator [Cytobacillus oceanisediminis]|jgi:DNA-binding IclR family transcriptional regulator|uniref:IclR family transcriptional regulator n=1 Tax=Cytobacillus oceanisediminis TaxID=665099 RepID=A0A2V2ZT55_9BACI|nr:IclR family transcriptional regulator [Cytobacillus oceanisediminis]PWW26857.1 IclR family transcriptional regulator [Cytobacillus oceanisediminis]